MKIIVHLSDAIGIVILTIWLLVIVVYSLIILISAKCRKIFDKMSEKFRKDREEEVDE